MVSLSSFVKRQNSLTELPAGNEKHLREIGYQEKYGELEQPEGDDSSVNFSQISVES